jgi:predicted SpoU family rRNA methylase
MRADQYRRCVLILTGAPTVNVPKVVNADLKIQLAQQRHEQVARGAIGV